MKVQSVFVNYKNAQVSFKSDSKFQDKNNQKPELFLDEFQISNQKTKENFLDTVKSVFKPKKSPTLGQQIDDAVNDAIKLIKGKVKLYNGYASNYNSLANLYNKIGKKSGFKQFVPCDSGNDKRLVFGDFDDETSLPKVINKISMADNMQIQTRYEFLDGTNLISVEDRTRNITALMQNGNLIAISEKDNDGKNICEYVLTKEGYLYCEKEIQQNKTYKPRSVFEYNKKNPKACRYIVLNANNKYSVYALNDKKKKKKTETLDEIEV